MLTGLALADGGQELAARRLELGAQFCKLAAKTGQLAAKLIGGSAQLEKLRVISPGLALEPGRRASGQCEKRHDDPWDPCGAPTRRGSARCRHRPDLPQNLPAPYIPRLAMSSFRGGHRPCRRPDCQAGTAAPADAAPTRRWSGVIRRSSARLTRDMLYVNTQRPAPLVEELPTGGLRHSLERQRGPEERAAAVFEAVPAVGRDGHVGPGLQRVERACSAGFPRSHKPSARGSEGFWSGEAWYERREGIDAPAGYRNGYGKPRRVALSAGTIRSA